LKITNKRLRQNGHIVNFVSIDLFSNPVWIIIRKGYYFHFSTGFTSKQVKGYRSHITSTKNYHPFNLTTAKKEAFIDGSIKNPSCYQTNYRKESMGKQYSI